MEIQNIDVSKIKFEDNSRLKQTKSSSAQLMSSIKEQGLLHPVVVAKKNTGYVIVCGHRRLDAYKKLALVNKAKFKTIPAVINNDAKNEKKRMVLNLVENLQREDVSMLELGRYFEDLNKKHKLTINEISAATSKPTTFVRDAIQMYKVIPEQFADDIRPSSRGGIKKGKITPVAANSFANFVKVVGGKSVSKQNRIKILNKLKSKELGAKDMAQMARNVKAGTPMSTALRKQKKLTTYRFTLTVSASTERKAKSNTGKNLKDYIIDKILSDKKIGLKDTDTLKGN